MVHQSMATFENDKSVINIAYKILPFLFSMNIYLHYLHSTVYIEIEIFLNYNNVVRFLKYWKKPLGF